MSLSRNSRNSKSQSNERFPYLGEMPRDFDLLSKAEAARLIRKSPRFLDRLHAKRKGPKRLPIGRTVYYRRSTLLRWLEQLEEQPVRERRR